MPEAGAERAIVDGERAGGPLLTRLTLKMMHDRADAIDAGLRTLGFAVPNAPVQPFDLLDDRRFRLDPRWVVNWRRAGNSSRPAAVL